MIHSAVISSFFSEFSKIAALDEKDKAVLKELQRQQSKFDQMAGSGQMTEAQKKLHRDNTARMNELLKKKRGDIKTVPRWVRDPKASAPTGRAPRPGPGGPHRPHGYADDFRHAWEAAAKRPANWRQTARAVAIPAAYTAGMVGLHQYMKHMGRREKAESADLRKRVRSQVQQQAAA